MLLVVEPSPLVSYLGGRLHVRPILSSPTIILHLARVLVPVGVLHKPTHELVVLEGAFELSAAVQLEAALALTFVFCPSTVVNASLEGVNSSPMFLIIDPLSIVVLILIVGVPSLSVFHAILPATLINGLFGVQVDEHAVAVLFALQKLALIAQILGFEGVEALAVVDA